MIKRFVGRRSAEGGKERGWRELLLLLATQKRRRLVVASDVRPSVSNWTY